MTQQTQQFCQQCHSSLQYIHTLGRDGLDAAKLSHAAYEANKLRLLAQAERRLILARYAQDLQYLCRTLQKNHHLHTQRQDYAELLKFGMQCGGCQRESCIEMRFDQLLDLETQLQTN